MVFPKWISKLTPLHKKFLLVISALILTTLILVLGFFVGLKYKSVSKNSDSNIVYNPTFAPVNTSTNKPDVSTPKNETESKYGWQTYFNRAVPGSTYSISFPVGQEGWMLNHAVNVDPYSFDVSYPDNNISDELVLEKNLSKIKITRKVSGGFPVCLYSDSDKTKNYMNEINFADYSEFVLGTRTARRAKFEIKGKEQEISTYIVCQNEENSQTFVNITQFGSINYEVPLNTDKKELDEIDSIIKTLKAGIR